MKKYSILLLIFAFAANSFAQKDDKQKKEDKDKQTTTATTVAISKTSTPMELAKAALAAHGGDKFKNMKTLIVRGSAEISGSPTQVISATFDTVFSGDKYRLEIINPMQPFKQVYDGQQTYSSMPNFQLPPLNRLGLPLLPKIEEKGFTVSELPEKGKNLGFRITSPEGYYTDFFLDEKTAQVKSYSAKYEVRGHEITTSVEIDKLKDVDGILIPEKYSQRFELGQLTMYANFKAKEILVNTAVADDVFVMN
ncbi:MAG TPA: hypothetical protein VGC76_19960 [Pyrinomonadaceae bacterium]|jgi:hypothetical protein